MEVVNLNEIRSEQETRVAGRYSASLLGTIRSNLEGLQGYDVIALELIQNADDAGAEEITFDVTDNGLLVWNSGVYLVLRIVTVA